ncbi:MAG: hypothetical protein R2783_00870 [Gelidibacter sp.]
MIFKVFKEKSNQKYINKVLNSRSNAIHQKKIQSVGVILNLKEFADLDAFRFFFKEMGILPPKTKIITFVEDNKITDKLWDTYFSPKDFGWKDTIKNIELQSFIDTEFDALISFYRENTLELNMITALSKANFKIGISNSDTRLYDLILDIQPNDFLVFKNELIKYLTVLNKL